MIETLTRAEYERRIELMLRDCVPKKIRVETVRRPPRELTAEMVSDRR